MSHSALICIIAPVRALRWLGGVAFVASLAYLVYFYLVTLASADGDTAHVTRNVLWNTALFTLFAGHHSVLARGRAKQWIRRLVLPDAERTLYVWVASILLAAVCVLWRSIPGMIADVPGGWRVPLYGLQLLGVALTIGGARMIDPLELAGIRTSPARSGTALQVVGPFRFVRHPIYLGWILMVWAAPTLTVNRLLFAAISSIYLILAIPWEERSLVADHGDPYRAYQRRVRWRLLPGIW
jgi:methanethiol S-methyltransferase